MYYHNSFISIHRTKEQTRKAPWDVFGDKERNLYNSLSDSHSSYKATVFLKLVIIVAFFLLVLTTAVISRWSFLLSIYYLRPKPDDWQKSTYRLLVAAALTNCNESAII